MIKVCKVIAYIAVSITLSSIAYCSQNPFFDSFNSYIIPLLGTLLAINLTAVALFLAEIKKLKEKLPTLNIAPLTQEVSLTMTKQIGIIATLIVILMIKDMNYITEIINPKCRTILVNAFSLCTLFYFLEVIYDTLNALLDAIKE